MDLLAVGGGAMGRWFARALPGTDVTVADTDPVVAREAADVLSGRTLVDTDTDTDTDADDTDGYDLVCVAVPIPAVEAAVAEHADRLREGGALVDVTGAMAPVVAAGREHAPDRQRLSLHPLFAPERAPGRIAAVPDAPGARTATVRRALERAGNEVFETTAAAHDRAMETVQARAHAAVLAFALAADPVPAEFSTPVFEALAETAAAVTGGEPHVYADVQATFDGVDDVAAAARRVADADRETFAALYREAGRPLSQSGDGDGDSDDAGSGKR
ncbi:prephenate dehydrogenase [Halobacteriales archaeon SW_5_70_135]|nr:MAG: prephenate dehydrogenase [Halobacteriales archaeon SW_5_70_135]